LGDFDYFCLRCKIKLNTVFNFCLSGLFFTELLQVMPFSPKENLCRLLELSKKFIKSCFNYFILVEYDICDIVRGV